MKIAWNIENPQEALQITSRKDFEEENAGLLSQSLLMRTIQEPKFCKVMEYQGVLSGDMVIPQKDHPIHQQLAFNFLLDGNKLYFIGDKKDVENLVQGYIDTTNLVMANPLEFLLGFMTYLISEDVYFLEDYNRKLEEIESLLFKGQKAGMEQFIMTTRKDMNILESYYLQLSVVGETLEDVALEKNESEVSAIINLYLSRVTQLLSMVQNIRDFTSQIWNLRQTQLSDQQNKISTVLTIITTIFLPLTLITGWFGMNFIHMPLIRTADGYNLIVVSCIVIVMIELAVIYFFIYRKQK